MANRSNQAFILLLAGLLTACIEGATWRGWGGRMGNRFAAQSNKAQGVLRWVSSPRDNLGPSIGCPIVWSPSNARDWTESRIIVGSAAGLNVRRPLNNQLISNVSVPDGISGCPTAPFDHVFLSTPNSRVTALVAGSLQQMWSVELTVAGQPIGLELPTSPMSDGSLVFVAAKNWVWALDGSTGAEKWRQTLADRVSSAAAPALMHGDDAGVVVATLNGHVYRLAPATGAVVWHRVIEGESLNQGAAIGISRTVYVAGFRGTLYALGADDGADKWPPFSTQAGRPLLGPAVDFRSNRDWIYFVDDTQTVYALDDSGTIAWKHPLPGKPGAPLVIAPDGVFYASVGSAGSAAVVAFNRERELWSVPTSAPARYLAVGPGGDVYATAGLSELYAIR